MKKNVPELRFRGFSQEWEEKRLGEYITERVEKIYENNYPLYSLTIEQGVVPKTERYERGFLVKKDGNFKVVHKNDFVYNPMNLRFGALGLYRGESPVSVSGYYNIFYFKKDTISEFWVNYLKTERVMYLYNTIATGSLEEKKRVHYSQFKELHLKVPSLQEQERIASFLTKVDRYIEKQDKKVQELEKYKKGMMQRIFSQKVRFRMDDGGMYPEWEEKRLGEVVDFYSTNSLSRDCLNNKNGKVRNIHYGDIHMKFPPILDAKKIGIPFINNDIDISNIKVESFCKNGDLLIADASEDYNDIGKAIEIINIGKKKIVSGLHTILARDNKGLTCNGFKGYMMLDQKVKKQIKVLAAGAKVLGISKANIAKVHVYLPSLQEQEKIANFFSKIDMLIDKEKRKLEELRKWKKGLLQKMFV